MSKTDKLIAKLREGRIDGTELSTLLGRLGWILKRQKGSHQHWSNGEKILVMVAERVDLKPYQIKEAQSALLKNEGEK